MKDSQGSCVYVGDLVRVGHDTFRVFIRDGQLFRGGYASLDIETRGVVVQSWSQAMVSDFSEKLVAKRDLIAGQLRVVDAAIEAIRQDSELDEKHWCDAEDDLEGGCHCGFNCERSGGEGCPVSGMTKRQIEAWMKGESTDVTTSS